MTCRGKVQTGNLLCYWSAVMTAKVTAAEHLLFPVLGQVDPNDLGITLSHEHLLVDFSRGLLPPPPGCAETLPDLQLSMENLGLIWRFPYSVRGNLQMSDVDEMTSELQLFKRAGGNTVCEMSVVGMRLEPHTPSLLARISRETQVNIVHATGFYCEQFLPEWARLLSAQEMEDFMVGEITGSVGESGVRCGVVYAGCSWPLADTERRTLAAAARTQSRTGVALVINPGKNEQAPFEILDILEANGADTSRVVIAHLDRTLTSEQRLLELARRGCLLNHSFFGKECSHYQYGKSVDMPSDAERVQRIKWLVDAGFASQVLMSQDVVLRHELARYGGYGYAHILEHIVPKMVDRGISRDVVMEILTENPRRLLTFA